jgi:hypothetical protein
VDLSHVLWIGGGPGSGKSSVARALSSRFDLQLYSVDDHDGAHEPRMPTFLADESFDGLLKASRHRFRLVLEDLAALPASPPAIVEGWQLLPTSVAAVLRDPGQALFLMPESADELTQRVGWEARDLRLATLRAGAPLDDLVERAAAHFLPVISAARDTSQ